MHITFLQNGVLHTALLGFKYMGKDKGGNGGVIVNTGSVAGIGYRSPTLPAYNASKAAVVTITVTLGVSILYPES